MRPPNVWGFKQEPSDKPVKHVLRADADPIACYADGRIQKILLAINTIS